MFPLYEKDKSNPLSPILNKVDKINLLPREMPIKSILCQKHPKLDFAEAIIEQQIVLINLNKGFIGEEATMILGALATSAIMEAVLYINRPLIQDLQAPLPVGLWVDEFPTFGTSLYRTVLMEFRKFGLNKLTLASQHVEKIDFKLRADIFNAAKHKVVFSVEPADADILAENYRRSTPGSEHFNPAIITELPPYHALVDGVETELDPFFPPHGTGKMADVIKHSRLHYT